MADALQNLSAISGALAPKILPRIQKTSNRTCTFLRVVPIRRGSSKGIFWDLESTGIVTENFTDGADVQNFGSDAIAPVTIPWAAARANFHISALAAAVAQSTQDPAELADLQVRNTENAGAALASFVNGQCFTGTGSSNSVTGLDAAIADDNTYAGVDRTQAANAFFRSKVVDPGVATAITIPLIRKDVAAIKKICGEKPDVGFVGPDTHNMLKALFDANRRWDQSVSSAVGVTKLESNADVVVIEGVQFVEDKDCVEGEILYVNSNHVHLEVLPAANGWGKYMQPNDGFGALAAGFTMSELAQTGASRKFTMIVFLNLVVDKPSTCGKRKNVLVS